MLMLCVDCIRKGETERGGVLEWSILGLRRDNPPSLTRSVGNMQSFMMTKNTSQVSFTPEIFRKGIAAVFEIHGIFF